MRNSSKVVAVVLLAAATILVAAAPVAGKSNSGQSAQPMRYDPETSTVEIMDQCSLTLSRRKGGWVCVNQDVHPNSGVCGGAGCWYYLDVYKAEFIGRGSYGFGGTPLGDVDYYIQDSFSGGKSTSKPFRFESSRGIRTIECDGERLYFSGSHPEGYPISGGASFRTWGPYGPYAAYALIFCFGSTGYTYYENTVAWAGIYHAYTWSDPSSAYPGYWYLWVKSPKFQRNSNGQYVVSNPPTMGTNWYGSGWHS